MTAIIVGGFLGRRLGLPRTRAPQALQTRRSTSEWFFWRRDLGGVTHFIKKPGSPNYHTFIQNFEQRGTWAWRDTAAHERVHAWIGEHAGPITSFGNLKVGRVPVGAPVLWAEETLAYSIGHAWALRPHAIPFAPLEAFGSLKPAERWVAGGTLGAAGAYLLLEGLD